MDCCSKSFVRESKVFSHFRWFDEALVFKSATCLGIFTMAMSLCLNLFANYGLNRIHIYTVPVRNRFHQKTKICKTFLFKNLNRDGVFSSHDMTCKYVYVYPCV